MNRYFSIKDRKVGLDYAPLVVAEVYSTKKKRELFEISFKFGYRDTRIDF